MNLAKKKQLAAKLLNVGKNKIKFANDKLPEIKEAITKQDIRDLYKEGFITIKPTVGKRKKHKRKTRIGPGKIRITVKRRKRDYMRITRKLRNYLKELKNRGEINNESYWEIRKKIKRRYFESKAYLKEHLEEIKKNKKETKIEVNTEKPKKQENKNKQKNKIKGENKK
jgi:large subunit ribosomal protein L19e